MISEQQAQPAHGFGHIAIGGVARTRQIDAHDVAHAPGTRRQYHNTIGQYDSFLDVVGDEQHVVLRSARMRSNSPCICERVCGSSFENGSSISRMRGSPTRLRASATRLRMPPDNWCGWLSANPSSPTISSAASARVRRSLVDNAGRAASRPNSAFARTERHGKSRSSWNM
ncbi:hypothetical protein A9R05_27975 [Burkholderia sp. KK1]|nr:hypothetical protein A9R05_27975 [Burkholderia sp. KK1]